MTRSRQRGFTLIELIVVIVILGILAAFAVPRYMGLENQARVSAVNAMAGSLRSAATMAHGVLLANGGSTSGAATITVNGTIINMMNGYPVATGNGSIQNLLQDTTGFTLSSPAGGVEQFAPNGARNAGCYVRYQQPAVAGTDYTLSYAVAGTPAQIETYLQNNC